MISVLVENTSSIYKSRFLEKLWGQCGDSPPHFWGSAQRYSCFGKYLKNLAVDYWASDPVDMRVTLFGCRKEKQEMTTTP